MKQYLKFLIITILLLIPITLSAQNDYYRTRDRYTGDFYNWNRRGGSDSEIGRYYKNKELRAQGKILSVSSTPKSFRLRAANGKTYVVDASSAAIYNNNRKTTFSSLRKNDRVTVYGIADRNNKIAARVVYEDSDSTTRGNDNYRGRGPLPDRDGIYDDYYRNDRVVKKSITLTEDIDSISTRKNEIIVYKSGKKITINLNRNTKIYDEYRNNISLSKLRKGDMIVIKGYMVDDDEIDANEIRKLR
jgi:hypothetical protein